MFTGTADQARALIAAHPLVHLVTADLASSHLPMLCKGDVLRGHLARSNPHWKTLDGQSALAIAQGPQGYISPSFYPSKAEHGRVVPTWNYAIAEFRGVLRLIEDPVWLRELVITLTDKMEADRLAPWAVTDAPADYIDRLVTRIVGVELTITAINMRAKLSQNKSADDRQGARDGAPRELAAAMDALSVPPEKR